MMSVPAVLRPVLLAAMALLAGCAAAPPPAAEPAAVRAPSRPAAIRYRCDQGVSFAVQFGDDVATIDAGSRGREVLLRDAGGVTPRETAYSNERLRAEFGLGVSGTEAVLRYAEPPVVARCRQE